MTVREIEKIGYEIADRISEKKVENETFLRLRKSLYTRISQTRIIFV